MIRKVEIPLDKRKVLLLFIGSIAFVILGLWTLLYPDSKHPDIIRFWGALAVIFFGAGTITSIKKLLDKKPGLINDSKGIHENTQGTSIGLIEWEDITHIKLIRFNSINFLSIHVINPEKYILKSKNKFNKQLMTWNKNMTQTPLSITTNTLKYDVYKLEALIQKEYTYWTQKAAREANQQ